MMPMCGQVACRSVEIVAGASVARRESTVSKPHPVPSKATKKKKLTEKEQRSRQAVTKQAGGRYIAFDDKVGRSPLNKSRFRFSRSPT